MSKYNASKDYNSKPFIFVMCVLLILVMTYWPIIISPLFIDDYEWNKFSNLFSYLCLFIPLGLNLYVWRRYKADLLFKITKVFSPINSNEGTRLAPFIVTNAIFFIITFLTGFSVFYPFTLLIFGFLEMDEILKFKNETNHNDFDSEL